MEASMEKQSAMTPSTHVQSHNQTQNPMWRLSPWHNGSTLYDSYEYRAVTDQLNRAMNGLNACSSPCVWHLKSPICRQRLDLMYKENAKTPKKISCLQSVNGDFVKKESIRGARGFVARLWKKLKRRLSRKKQGNDSI